MTRAKNAEPPSQLQPPLFILGQNDRGDWVVQDQNGGCGGLFVDRKAALGFVRAQNRRQPHNLVVASGILELDMSDNHRIHPLTAPAHAAKNAARRH